MAERKGEHTYIAGHRLGYEGTNSYLIFYYLDQLAEGDEILLEDAAGTRYEYRVHRNRWSWTRKRWCDGARRRQVAGLAHTCTCPTTRSVSSSGRAGEEST